MCQSDRPSNVMEDREKEDSLRLAQENREREEAWVNAQFAQLKTENQKLGQLFMTAVYPNTEGDEKEVFKDIDSFHVGGIIVFKGTPARIAKLTNLYQSRAKIPLLVSMDAEWGIAMRVDSVERFPRQLLMGAMTDNRLMYEFGKEVARQCRRIGVNINFAPVVDVNNNPNNPVINDRSFGESRENVTAKAYQYIKGMQDNGVMACAKHFPGHGDTDVDSHHDLPVIRHDMKRLDSIELYPFRSLSQHGVQSVMVGHLQVPAIDSSKNVPSTLSKNAIQHLLKDTIGFEGLVFTDAMNMQGVAKHWSSGKADAMSLVAGTDILLMTQDIPAALREIKAAIAKGDITWEEIDRRIKKVLHAKYRLGLHSYKPVDLKNVAKDLNTPAVKVLHENIVANAITLVQDSAQYLPVRAVRGKKIATLALNSGRKNAFQYELDKYGIKEHHFAGNSITGSNYTRLMELAKNETVIVSIERIGKLAIDDFGVSESVRKFVTDLSAKTRVVMVVFGSPYSLKFFESTDVLVAAYNDEDLTQSITAQTVMGGLPFRGRLPVSASAKLKYGMGMDSEKFRMAYALQPEDVGLSSEKLKRVDQIAQDGIKKGAYPGCQVIVVKDGKIALHRTYGYHTPARRKAVERDDIYDLASVTKIAATTISLMKLYEQGKFDIEKTMGDYLPALKGTNKADLVIKEVLAHQSGLKAWIPFYTKTLDVNKQPMPTFYQPQSKGDYCVRVAEGMYFCKSAVDTVVWQRIYDSPLESKVYRYSDLGFYLFAPMVHNMTGKPLDEFAAENFYRQMGLEFIGYNPLKWGVSKSRIVPTEKDDYFRYREVHGDVHDMGAAMIDGVSGHAGLFATPADIAAVMQMIMDGGVYNNRRYLEEETVKKFIAQYTPNSRRGLGFDRKEKGEKPNESVNVAYQASDNTFGHLGFTGIGAWADPDNKLVYIFLSNRTYPDSENNQLSKLGIRAQIHEAIYDAFIK